MPDRDDDVKRYQKNRRLQFPIIVILLHWIYMILFGVFVRYTPHQAIATWNPYDLKNGTEAEKSHPDFETTSKFDEEHADENKQFIDVFYPMYEDVQVMVFIGFGFILAFMRFYAITAVSMNFLMACLALEWAILMNGWFEWARHPEQTALEAPSFTCGWGMNNYHDNCSPLDIYTITRALFGCSTVLISLGALLGKISPSQMAINSLIELTMYAINRYIILDLLEANDSGHGMSVHAFGAYWGIAVAAMVWAPKKKLAEAKGARESYNCELFVFVGTLFLFTYWPSWNAFEDVGVERHRAVINTFLALISSCITTFALSGLFDPKGRFTVQHLQYATLAGGVGIGSIANSIVHPFGALLIGMMAGVVCILGYQYLTPALNRIGLHDSAGVHNLHGLMGIYASVVSAIVAGCITIERTGTAKSEWTQYPAMAPFIERVFPKEMGVIDHLGHFVEEKAMSGKYPDWDRDQSRQGGLQFVAILITMAMSISGGLVTGVILRFIPGFDSPHEDHLAEDSEWFMPVWEEAGFGVDAPVRSWQGAGKDEMRLEDSSSEGMELRRRKVDDDAGGRVAIGEEETRA